MASSKVSFVCTSYRRFRCVERIIAQYHAQTYENKELIIFNTDIEHPFSLGFNDNSIIIINNDLDYLTGKPYTNRGSICRDAVTHAVGDFFMLADDDDVYLPWHITQAVDGILSNGKDSWKPAKSMFSTRNQLDIVGNTMEASVIVKMQRIRDIGFRTDQTGYEGLSWYMQLRNEGELDEYNQDYVPSYCFNWSDPPDMCGHKQSGNISSPDNFNEHKKASKDFATRPFQKLPLHELNDFYSKYYMFLDRQYCDSKLNSVFFNRYAVDFINQFKENNTNNNQSNSSTPKVVLKQINSFKPKSIHDLIPSEFFTNYDSYDYIFSGNYYEWYWALGKVLKPKTFLEIGVRFGFSFLSTIESSPCIESALGWDLETYGNNNIANANIKNYYTGNADWEIQHKDSQLETELPSFFDLVSIDGCHDYDCKIHDLKLCIGKCKYVILDDYDYHPHVRQATDFFLQEYSNYIEWNEYIPTFRGSKLIKYKL